MKNKQQFTISKGIQILTEKIRTLRKSLYAVYQSDKLFFTSTILVILLNSIFPIAAIYFSSQIINVLASKTTDVTYFIFCWGGCLLINNLLSPLIPFLQSNLGDKSVCFINRSIIEKSNSLLSLSHFDKESYYNDIQIISDGAQNKPINLVVTVMGIFGNICTISYSIALLFTQLSYLTILVLACIILHGKMMSNIQTKLWIESLGRSPKSRRMNYLSSLSTNVAHAKEMRIYGVGEHLISCYQELFNDIYRKMFGIRLKLTFLPLVPSIILLIGNVVAIYTAVESIRTGTLGIGSLALILQLFMQLHHSIMNLGMEYGWLSQHLLFFEKYFHFLSIKEDSSYQKQISHSEQLRDGIHTVKFENVSFTYLDGRNVLNNINFEITSKEKIAIVGENGSGKTTLIKLICGFYHPTSGRILINGNSIETYNVRELWTQIATVFQDFGCYAFPLKKNIALDGKPIVSNNLKAVIQTLDAGFIHRLPEGINTPLGKMFGGTDLSIGQWQKIAIARALYKDTSLLILDEPTASLDAISENEIYEHFEEICKDKTAIYITHRLASVSMADKILVLDKGNQIGFDAHHVLMKCCKKYQQMHQIQSTRYTNATLD